MKSKTLPAIRITANTTSRMESALKKLNQDSIIEITQQDFRRLCYEFFSQKVLSGEEIKKLQLQ